MPSEDNTKNKPKPKRLEEHTPGATRDEVLQALDTVIHAKKPTDAKKPKKRV